MEGWDRVLLDSGNRLFVRDWIAVGLAESVPCQEGPATYLPSPPLTGGFQGPPGPALLGKGLLGGPHTREDVQGPRHLTSGLQAFLDGLDLRLFHAHALPVHQCVQGLLHSPGRVAAQARAAAGGVHAAGHPLAQGASGTTAAAGLTHQLLAAHGGAAASQLLLGAGWAVDGFVSQARPGPGGQQQRGHEAKGQHDRARTGRWRQVRAESAGARAGSGGHTEAAPGAPERPDREKVGRRGGPAGGQRRSRGS